MDVKPMNVLVSLGSAILFTYMSSYSCSRVFQGSSGACFTFLIVNFLMMTVTKAWKQICVQFIFLLHIFVLVTMIVSLSYSVIQSFCGYVICVNGLNELGFYNIYCKIAILLTNTLLKIEYYTWFNTQGIGKQLNVSCYDDITIIEQKFLDFVKLYDPDTQFQYGDQYSILYGWPISCSVIMMILTSITLVITYRAIFSCHGCSVQKSDFAKNYFSFSDDEDDDDEEEEDY